MPSLLDLASETRLVIYFYLFLQPSYEILGLSREPEHDYRNGPPSDWVADSRQVGLVYASDSPRAVPTNSRALRTCRKVYDEAITVFYQTNKIRLYSEDNNDIFYWLLDIGARNRRAIKHLEIGWACILQTIADMSDSDTPSVRHHRAQLCRHVQRLENKTVHLIIRTLNLLLTSQALTTFAIYLPGVDGGDIWDLPNDNLYFEQEIFSNSTTNVHACIPKALAKMRGLQRLEVGYTKDIKLAEEIARKAGANELIVRTCPEDHTLNLDESEQKVWRARGWKLDGPIATKILRRTEDLRQESSPGWKTNKNSPRNRKESVERTARRPSDMILNGEAEGPEQGHVEQGRLTAAMIADGP